MIREIGGFFVTKTDCPVCQGSGEVETCSTEDSNCCMVRCDHCGGKGFHEQIKVGRLLFVLGIIAVISLILQFIG